MRIPLHPSATRTASGVGESVRLGGTQKAIVYINVTAVAGTLLTLVVGFQDSPDGVTFYDTDISSGTLAVTGQSRFIHSNPVGPYLRAKWTIGGTAPSFTFSVDWVCEVFAA